MSVTILIPARYASTRFPAKPLAPIKGQDGVTRSLIEHTFRAAQNVKNIDAIYVVTDDERIEKVAQGFGAKTLMTPPECKNGTERCSEALKQLQDPSDIIVNFQGDAPLTPPWFVEDVVEGLKNNPDFDMATPVLKCDAIAKDRLLADRAAGRVGGTTALFDRSHKAIYFSKEVLPYGAADTYHHVGVYAYRPKALKDYATWPEGILEASEGLEQLRFIENNRSILCVNVDAKGRDFWEVNNPEDVTLIENMHKA